MNCRLRSLATLAFVLAAGGCGEQARRAGDAALLPHDGGTSDSSADVGSQSPSTIEYVRCYGANGNLWDIRTPEDVHAGSGSGSTFVATMSGAGTVTITPTQINGDVITGIGSVQVENGDTGTMTFAQAGSVPNCHYQHPDGSCLPSQTIEVSNQSTYEKLPQQRQFIEIIYASQDGAGSPSSGAGGTDENNTRPISWVNSESNWSSSARADGLIGPGDKVVIVNTQTVDSNITIHASGTVDAPIEFDGYGAGECDALNTTCTNSAVVRGEFVVDHDYITIRDFVFRNQYSNFIEVAVDEGEKATGIIAANNRFSTSHSYAASIRIGFGTDITIKNNYYSGDGASETKERFVTVSSGSRIRVINNHVVNSYVGLFFGLRADRDQNGVLDFPASGSYTEDPESSMFDIEVAHNLIGRRHEEGISFDDGDANSVYPVVELDTVASIDGNRITLDNTGKEWDGKGDIYTGLYMTSLGDRRSAFGRISRIEEQSDNVFVVDASNPLTDLSVGDQVVIGLVHSRLWVHHNEFYDGGFGASTMLFEGIQYGSLAENNRTPPRDYAPIDQGWGIAFSGNHRRYKYTHSITGAWPENPITHSVIRYNTVGVVGCYVLVGYNGFWMDTAYYQYNACSAYDNRLHDTYYDREVRATHGEVYFRNNVYTSDGSPASEHLGLDATKVGTDYGADTPAAIYQEQPPNIKYTRVAGTTLTVTFTEPISNCRSGEACGFYVEENDNPVSIICTGGTGETRTFELGETLESSAFLYHDGTSGIIDRDGMAMHEWSATGADLLTDYLADDGRM